MKKNTVTIGMVGAGRATQLHMQAYKRVTTVDIRFKTIVSSTYEKSKIGKEKFGFEIAGKSFDDILLDSEIDIVDICTPPYTHENMIISAIKADKHVICEKPLTGYYGDEGDKTPIGLNVSKVHMYERTLEKLERLKSVVADSDKKFMFAENFIYAPAIQKMAEIISKKKSKILCIKGEESLKGSSSPVAGEWDKTGGGTFTRTGGHPLAAALWLKQTEAKAKGIEIKPISVVADVGYITNTLNEYEHRHIAARPNDVEDFGTAIITFSDSTKAIIIATDTLLGGSKNYVEAYCNDSTLHANLTLSNMMSTYFLDEDNLEDVYISEMLPSKTGWNNPTVIDEIVRGYSGEIQDFVEAVAFNKEAVSNFDLAYETTKVTYAAYMSAQSGKKINL